MEKQRMICLQHASRRRGAMGDDGGLTIESARYRLDENGRVWVLPAHAELALQGTKWREVSDLEMEIVEKGSPAQVEDRLRRQVEELLADNANLRGQLAALSGGKPTAPPVSAPIATPIAEPAKEAPARPEPAAQPVSDDTGDDLAAKTREELSKLAEDMNLDLPKGSSKVKLLSGIRSALEG